jgi:PAS domain S-box-containing protein
MQLDDLSSLSSFLDEGLIIFDKTKKIIFTNATTCVFFACEEKSLTGTSVEDLIQQHTQGDPQQNKDILQTVSNVCDPQKNNDRYKGLLSLVTYSGVEITVEISIGRLVFDGVVCGAMVFSDRRAAKDLFEYKKLTHETLSKLTPVFQKTATGDFSSKLDISNTEEGEFHELLVGVQIMMDDLVDLSVKKETEQTNKIEIMKCSESELSQKVEQASLELQKAKQHIETIVESLTSGLVEYDSDFHIRRINRSAENILGIKREDVLGTKVLPEHKDQKEKEALAIVSYPVLAKEGKRIDGKTFGFDDKATVHEITINYPIRKELEVVTLALIDPISQNHEGFIKVIRDVTKEKEISKSKSEFINIAAHQLRTPLSAVKWVARMILDGDVGALNPDQRKLLDKGYEENDKMITMVNDLLNVARIEDDRFGYVLKEGDIVDSVASVIDELRIISEKGGIELIFDKPARISSFVFDATKIQLAMHNLIGNAIKYTLAGGTVRVGLKMEATSVVIEVQDTGVGIPAGQIDKMFTKFFRAENAVRLQVGGSGLGLFIVKDIIARHGGDITVKSIEGKGTTFTVRIPMKHLNSSVAEVSV